MTIPQALVLGAVQGLTEFLPVSSSAHLYIVPKLLGWNYSGVGFDVALHWGTLFALLVSFAPVWAKLARDAFVADADTRGRARGTWLKIVAASIPTALAGYLLRDLADTALRNLPLQAAMLFVFGLLLWWIDRVRPETDHALSPGWATSLWIGAAQVLSLVPGVSRSGITITAGRASRLSRVSAARFSFLLATPITLGAGLFELHRLPANLPVVVVACGVVSSAAVGWLAIHGLMRFLGHAGFGAFFLYRTLLAILIVVHLAQAGSGSVRTVAPRHPIREVAVQAVAQEDARAMQPRLDRRHRQLEHLGDLGIR
jgi:undecaprenyl-diphosphatase